MASENGKTLIQFAQLHDLVVESTKFQHKRIHKGAWIIPGTMESNQIDHALINKRQASIRDLCSVRETNCDSDHFLVSQIYTKNNEITRKQI